MADENSGQGNVLDFFEPIEVEEAQDFTPDTPAEIGTEPVSQEQQVQPETPAPQAEAPVDPQDPNGKRFSYFQSLAAQRENENKMLKSQIDQMTAYMPVVEYIQRNPQLLDVIEQQVSTPQGPQRPVAPQKPANFSIAEATQDDNSASAQYMRQVVEYNEAMANYFATQEEARSQREQQMLAEQQAKMQQQQAYQQIAQYAVQRHGYTPQEAMEFIQEYSKDESYNLDNLITLHKIKRGKLQAPNTPVQTPKLKTPEYPTPAGVGGGEMPQSVTDEEVYNASLRLGQRTGSVLWRNKPK